MATIKESIKGAIEKAPVATLSLLPPLLTCVGFAISHAFPESNLDAQSAIFNTSNALSFLNLSSIVINTLGVLKSVFFDKDASFLSLIKDPKFKLKTFAALMGGVGLFLNNTMMEFALNNMDPGSTPMFPLVEG